MIIQKETSPAKYRSYSLHNFRSIPQLENLSEELKFNMDVVGYVLPFKVNNYVIDELIDWTKVPDDPIFKLTFPQKAMLTRAHFNEMAKAMRQTQDKSALREVANKIRMQLNPHPAGQLELNVPQLAGTRLNGVQHKYDQTVLFFPSQGQTCHAYCTFCFRWPQFVGMGDMKFAMKESEMLAQYVKQHPEVTDVLFTGGDPLIMKTRILQDYIEKLLDEKPSNLQTIRIGTKAFGYWPYRFLTDDDADDLLQLFERIVRSGINLAIMAHFNHPVELSTKAVQRAIRKIRATGAQIRTQSPVLNHINADPQIWAEMWRKQVNLNCIPYYMFVPRDTGAQHYFSVPLVECWDIFRNAYKQVSGICRTVRGPSMSATPGKVQVLGVTEIPVNGKFEKVLTLRFLQGRNPDWVGKPFFAKYNPEATWLNELTPAFGEKEFFFEKELEMIYKENISQDAINPYE
ncbi:MAG: lysine 2,3-aminomutase [Bacteroidetes bacterium]|nr:lysine 2,3-aminomutase [Bacteroidota bacterium]